jgi:transglutaminase-like putative cysteine protease
MRYRVKHETVYAYGSDVVHSHQLLHLVPRPSPYQQCVEHSLAISPTTFSRRDETDAFGNLVTRVEVEHAHRQLEVSTDMEVEVHARPPVPAADTLPWEEVRELLSYTGGWPARDVLDASRFRHESPYVRVKQVFTEYGAECFEPGRPVLACAQALMQKLHRELRYAPGETNIATPLVEVLKNRRGVCQDFAHLMIACLRARGLAARYVSGYIRLRPSKAVEADCGEVRPEHVARLDVHTIDSLADITASGTWLSPGSTSASQSQSQSQSASDLESPVTAPPDPQADSQLDWVGAGASHAWVSVYVPPFGWIELDPTNNVHVGTDHIAVAWGRDFGDVSPLRGVILGGGTHTLSVRVTVEPLHSTTGTSH